MSVPMDPSSMPSISRALFSLLVNDIRSEREREERETRKERLNWERGNSPLQCTREPRPRPRARPHRHLWSGEI